MDFSKVKTEKCLNQPASAVEVLEDDYVPETTDDPRCATDLEFAALNPSLCSNAPSIIGLLIRPETGAKCEGGKPYRFTARLQFQVGDTAKEKDVTAKATWSSSDTSALTSEGRGLFQSQYIPYDPSGASSKNVVVYAKYETTDGKSYSDDAPLEITDHCIKQGSDIVLVIDRSGSMLRDDASGVQRLTAAKEACKSLIEQAEWPDINQDGTITQEVYDRIAVISYAGDKEWGSNTHEHVGLTPTKDLAITAVDEIKVSSECGGEGSLETCATGMGGGLEAAYELLKKPIDEGGTRSPCAVGTVCTPTVRRLIVLMTDGVENVCSPPPETVAQEIKGDGEVDEEDSQTAAAHTIIVVVGFAVNGSKSVSKCDGSSRTVDQYLGADIAGCDLYYKADNMGELVDVFSRIHTLVCDDNNRTSGTPCKYIAPPLTDPVLNPCLKDRFNYHGFKENRWKVFKGKVDLMGADVYVSLQAGNGQYVGLIGHRGRYPFTINNARDSGRANCQKFYAPWDECFGGIETGDPIALAKGSYRLTVKLAGNLEVQFPNLGNDLQSSVRLSVGGTMKGLDQAGFADPSLENRMLGTINGTKENEPNGWHDGKPKLVTRELQGGHSKVITVDPMASFADFSMNFTSSGESAHIRVEQFPRGWDTNEWKYDVTSVFTGRSCTPVNPVTVKEFSGFWTDGGHLKPYEENEDYRYQTSGADEEIGPRRSGILVGEVLLERISPAAATIFTENFDNEDVCS